jgi:hypothetical protein
MDQAQQALVIAREVNDPTLLARSLTACVFIASQSYNAEAARPYFAEAIGLARAIGDRWRLSQILPWQGSAAIMAGDPIAARAAAEEGRDLADAIGDRSDSRACRMCLGWAQLMEGDLAGAVTQFGAVVADAEAAHDAFVKVNSLRGLGFALAYQGEVSAARAAADAELKADGELGEYFRGLGYSTVALAALAAGDVAAAQHASEAAWQHLNFQPTAAASSRAFQAQAALASGDLIAARRLADDAVTTTAGWHLIRGADVTGARGDRAG